MAVSCADYRMERRLLALRRELLRPDLPPEQAEAIRREIKELERYLGMD